MSIRMVIEADDHPSWAECTKETIAERLSDLGGVRVVEVTVDKPQQMGMFAPRTVTPPPLVPPGNVCPKCGQRVARVPGPEGAEVARDVKPKSIWLDPDGPFWAQDLHDKWLRVRLDGDRLAEHTVGFLIHQCGTGK